MALEKIDKILVNLSCEKDWSKEAELNAKAWDSKNHWKTILLKMFRKDFWKKKSFVSKDFFLFIS